MIVNNLPLEKIEKRKEELETALVQSRQLIVETQNKINALSEVLQQCDLFIAEINKVKKEDQTYNDVKIDDVAKEEGESDTRLEWVQQFLYAKSEEPKKDEVISSSSRKSE